MSGEVKLPSRMDTAGAIALEARLGGTGDVSIDAADVDMMGGLCLEVLTDAIRRRQESGAAVSISNVSDGFLRSLSTFGLDPETLVTGGVPT